MQDCSNWSVLAMELLQFCTKQSIWCITWNINKYSLLPPDYSPIIVLLPFLVLWQKKILFPALEVPGVMITWWRKHFSRWRHQMETFSALLAICAGNSPVPGEFPAQRPVTRSFDVFFELRLNKQLNKQSWGWWFGKGSRSLRRHRNVLVYWPFVRGIPGRP